MEFILVRGITNLLKTCLSYTNVKCHLLHGYTPGLTAVPQRNNSPILEHAHLLWYGNLIETHALEIEHMVTFSQKTAML